MNKTLKIVLVLSLAANAIWLLGSVAGYFSVTKTPAINAGPGMNATPQAAKEINALLSTSDMVALRDKLKAMGLSDDVVRSIVGARISSRYNARAREIFQAAIENAKQQPYWRGSLGFSSFMSLSPEQQKELRELGREASQESKRVLGDSDISYSYSSLRYPFLSPEKAQQLRDIESDYGELRLQIMQEMSGFRMPGDSEKLKLLDTEKERDLQAALTPEEREANNLRNSPTAASLKRKLAGFDATEDEYKTIFALQNALDEKYPTSSLGYVGGADMTELFRARSEAQKEVDSQIQAALGSDRYAEYVRATRSDYQSLMAAAQRFNLSADTVAQTYQARDAAAGDARRISDDKSLSAEEKTQAYAALAEQAQGQIRAALGDEVGDAYINNALPWLKNLPKGGRVMVDSRGNVHLMPTSARAGK